MDAVCTSVNNDGKYGVTHSTGLLHTECIYLFVKTTECSSVGSLTGSNCIESVIPNTTRSDPECTFLLSTAINTNFTSNFKCLFGFV